MAIPLRRLTSSDSESHPPRNSLDSETSAILSYALGKHVDNEDQTSEEDDSPRASTSRLNYEDDDGFFKENDPLTSDYDPFRVKRVSSLPRPLIIYFSNGGRNLEDFESVSVCL